MTGTPLWQRGFYDHIIRDEATLNRIREYIATNSWVWHLDRENPKAPKGRTILIDGWTVFRIRKRLSQEQLYENYENDLKQPCKETQP